MLKRENLRKNFLRVKQIADQNLGRVDKTEVLSEDLLSVEKRVENVRQVFQSTTKKLQSTLQTPSSDVEKRLKKMPETALAHSMIESAALLSNDNLLGTVFQICGECQSTIARELLQYELNVENNVLGPLGAALNNDVPTIAKLRKHLSKLTLDMDSAKNRYTAAHRQLQAPGSNVSAAAKVDTIKDEFEDACNRVEQGKDALATEMFNFISKEPEQSKTLHELMEAQALYHRRALEEIEKVLPKIKASIETNPHKPVYGIPLQEHLRVTERDIALVIEACILTLLETGMEEEGLFRIAGMASKVKKLKASFDAGIMDMEEYDKDCHTVGGALKQYLRELPEPLLTYELYNEFMKAAQSSSDQRLSQLIQVIEKLPAANYNNFRFLIKFLAKLADKSEINKMTPYNIAIVIGPNLLWSQEEKAPNMLKTGTLSNAVELIITNADNIFPGALDFHLCQRGSAPPRSGDAFQENTSDVSPKPSGLAKKQRDNNINKSTSENVASSSTTGKFVPEPSSDLSESGSEGALFLDCLPPLTESPVAATNITNRNSAPPGEQSHKQKNLNNMTGTNANPRTVLNPPPRSKKTSRSSSVPSAPACVSKSFHSDVYSTAFALQSLGNGSSSSSYLTKVRAMWDGQFYPPSQTDKKNDNENDYDGSCSRVNGGQRKSLSQEIDFEVSQVPSTPGSSPKVSVDRSPNLELNPMENNSPTIQVNSISQLEHSPLSSPQIPTSDNKTPVNLAVNTGDSDSQGQSSPVPPRRLSKKPAPPPPPEKQGPYSVAVTATIITTGQNSQYQTWPRNSTPPSMDTSITESPVSKTRTLQPERTSQPPERPPAPLEKPHVVIERSASDRPSGPPPERPKGPPPCVPSHQRSASAGDMFGSSVLQRPLSVGDTPTCYIAEEGTANLPGTTSPKSRSSLDITEKDSSLTVLLPACDNTNNSSTKPVNSRPARPTPPPPPPPNKYNSMSEDTRL